MVLGQANNVALAYGALLEVDKPFLKAMDVEDVLTHRNFHQLFFLLEVLETEPTLLLISHVSEFGI